MYNMHLWWSTEKPHPVPEDEQHVILRALCAALAFEPFAGGHKSLAAEKALQEPHEEVHAQAHTLARGTITPDLSEVDLEESFYDAVEFHDENDLHLAFSRSPSVEMIRGGASTPIPLEFSIKSYEAPPPPLETPLRFLRAGKNDPVMGKQRYQETLKWRQEQGMNTILKEPQANFELIKEHYPHYYHLKGKNGQYCYYECPPRTNLRALKSAGLTIQDLLRHYAFVTEFGWQYIDRNDFGSSIYIIDLQGIRLTDFVGECVDFVKKTAQFTGQHYPERAGYIYVVNVPSWFKVIWNVVKPLVDEDTLKKVFILRGKKEIFNALSQHIAIENIPPEYGGTSVPLGQAPEERLLWSLVRHNNALALGFRCEGLHDGPSCHFCAERGLQCQGVHGTPPCQFCTFRYARSY